MEKNTLTKWLLISSEKNDLKIVKMEISKYTPINRMLDIPGYYSIYPVIINQKRYLIAYESNYESVLKNKILISRIHDYEEKIIDMVDGDYDSALKIAHDFMGYTTVIS